MRARLLVTVAAVLGLLLPAQSMVAAPPAAADDYYFDTIQVESVSAEPSLARVNGLRSTPVTITLTTRGAAKGQQSLSLVEHQHGAVTGPLVPLRRVADDDGLTTWRGVAHLTGPTRVQYFSAAWPCLVNSVSGMCPGGYTYPDDLSIPLAVRVVADHAPAITMTTSPSTVALDRSGYELRGRVVDSATGRPYPQRVDLSVRRGWRECYLRDGGRAVTTARDGTFATVKLANTALRHDGAPVLGDHCVVALQPGVLDSARRRPWSAHATFRPAWSSVLPVSRPSRVRAGSSFVVRTLTRLPQMSTVRVQRLHGRTAWRTVAQVPVNYAGGASARLPAGPAGRAVYRLVARPWNLQNGPEARSRLFAVTTTR